MTAKKRKKLPSSKHAQQPATPREWPWFTEWLGPGLIVIVFLALTAWSWRKWPDLQVDFGQALYVPWQLASGKLLYKDLVFLHGPLSQHLNALWFRLFGPSLTVLIFVNLAVLAGMTGVIFRTILLFADRLTATTVCIVLLCLFGFSQYVGIGNYNYIAPYNHEATHGVALTAALILGLSRYMTRWGRAAGAFSGICLGLVLLTKVEVALAAAAVALMGFAMACFVGPPNAAPKRDGLMFFFALAVAPALGFVVYFLSYLPAEQAVRAVGQGFWVFSEELAKNPFFMWVLGLDKIGDNLSRMLVMFGAIVIFVLAAATGDLVSRRMKWHPQVTGIVLGGVFFLGLLLNLDLLPWQDIPRALPVTTALTLVVFVTLLIKHPRRRELWPTILPMVLWSTFALVLLAKMALNVHLYHYGFFLAMPATLVFVICLTYWIPRALAGTLGYGIVFRSLAFAVLAAGIIYHLNWSQKFYRLKTFAVGKDGDTILTYGPEVNASGTVTALTLQWIEEKTPAEATFVGLPEGIMLNYLARRTTTLPYLNFMMTEMIVFGEQRMVEDLKARPPDYMLLVHKDTSEWGVGPFGADARYGQQIMHWVNQHYEPVVLIGNEPFQRNAFGIKILKRVS